jgi:hypothetical protein
MIVETNTGETPRSLLASLLKIGPEECLAIRRHATRVESRGDLEGAFDAYRIAALLEPDEPAAWRGLERVLRARGERDAAAGAALFAELLEGKRRRRACHPSQVGKGGAR